MEEKKFTLHFDKAKHIFDVTRFRVHYFSKLPELIAYDALTSVNWEIEGEQGSKFNHGATISTEVLTQISELFPAWTNAQLLRDLFESFYLFLDNMYDFCLFIANVEDGKALRGSEEIYKDSIAYKNDSVENKLRKLKGFGIQVDQANDKKLFNSFKDIRDCLAHNAGIVHKKMGFDDKDKNYRKVCWKTLEHRLQLPGERKTRKLKFPCNVDAGTTLVLRIKEHHKRLKIRDEISFSRKELWEMSFTLDMMVDAISQQVHDYANRNEAKELEQG